MHYIYKFLNESMQPIYIGITNNIARRIKGQHFGGNGHLPEEVYEEAYIVLYAECVSDDDAKIKERYFINKIQPRYNTRLNKGSDFSFTITEPDWIYLPVNKDELLKKIEKKKEKKSSLDNQLKEKIISEPTEQPDKPKEGLVIEVSEKTYQFEGLPVTAITYLIVDNLSVTMLPIFKNESEYELLKCPLCIFVVLINGELWIDLSSFEWILGEFGFHSYKNMSFGDSANFSALLAIHDGFLKRSDVIEVSWKDEIDLEGKSEKTINKNSSSLYVSAKKVNSLITRALDASRGLHNEKELANIEKIARDFMKRALDKLK